MPVLQAVADSMAGGGAAAGGSTTLMWIQMVEIAVIGVSAFLVWVQIRKNNEWRRRQASHDFLYELISGEFKQLREYLEYELGVEYRNEDQTYDSIRQDLDTEDERRELYVKTSALFNFFELMAVAIKNGVLDEDICFDSLAPVLIEYRRWGRPLIDERSPEGYRTTWVEFVSLSDKWTERRLDQEERAEQLREKAERHLRERLRGDGKDPL